MLKILFMSLLINKALFVSGHVYDAITGQAIVGAGVVIQGTKNGTMTDLDGYYNLSIDSAGLYSLRASMIGYKDVTKKIKIKNPRELNFYLKTSAFEMPEQVVKSSRAVQIEKRVSANKRAISSNELENTPIENVQEVIAKRIGAVAHGTEFHIRGSRSNEILLMIDGIPVRDPLSGSSFGIYIPKEAISSVETETGGFNAEYGQATSGIINYNVNEGSKKFGISLSYKTDNLRIKNYTNTDIADISLYGPLNIVNLPGNLTYFMTIYGKSGDTYLPHTENLYSSVFKTDKLSPREDNMLSGTFKLTYKCKSGTKLSFLLSRSIAINQGYFYSSTDYPFFYGFPYKYINILPHALTFTRDGNQQALSFKKIIDMKNFIDIKFSRFFTNLHADVAGKNWTQYKELADTIPRDQFYDIGDAPYWHDHYLETYTLKGDYTKIFNKMLSGKTGLILQRHELQWIDIDYPWYSTSSGLGLNHDIYRTHSITGGAYVQTTIRLAGMVANLGMRLDYWMPGYYVDNGVRNALKSEALPFQVQEEYNSYLNNNFSLKGHIFKAHISPRLGFSYPITENDKFFLSYGHFAQIPDLKYVYSKLGRRASSTYELIGNPNLDQIVSVAYEMGVKHLFNDFSEIKGTAYYKDIFNYPTARKIQGIPPNPDYWMYFNSDYSRSVGIEVYFKREVHKHIFTDFTLTFSQDKGRASSAEDAYWLGGEESLKEWYLKWDRPFKLFYEIGYTRKIGDYIKINNHPVKFASDFKLILQASVQSGRRYTPMDTMGNRGDINAKTGPVWHRADIIFRKGLMHSRGRSINFFLEARNIFNHKNVYYINPVTGRDYREGDPMPPKETAKEMENPARYRAGRIIKAGVDIKW